uniref:Uncharacterized protein n=1 Tax=Arcella intermedia TaxID=1963864 RepID=A0A6B2LPF5_9EUKA
MRYFRSFLFLFFLRSLLISIITTLFLLRFCFYFLSLFLRRTFTRSTQFLFGCLFLLLLWRFFASFTFFLFDCLLFFTTIRTTSSITLFRLF